MAYELHVNAGVAGQQQLDELTRKTETQSAATNKLNDALYGASKAGEKASLAAINYATQLAKTEEWTLRYKTAQLAANEATDRGTQSTTRLGAAHGAAVSQIQAVGGALRTMEGAMPIRAAERFLTLIPGIGSALQVAFPIFGAIAFSEVLVRMGGEVVHLASKWDPVIAAQVRSKELVKEETAEIVKMGKQLEELRFANIGRMQGPGAELRARAEAQEAGARGAGSLAALYRREIADAEAAIALGRQAQSPSATLAGLNLTGASSRSNTELQRNAALAAARLPGLRTSLAEATMTQAVMEQTAQGQRADAAMGDRRSSSREEAQHDRVDREIRNRALQADVKEWEGIQKLKEKAAHELATLFDHPMPALRDESRRQMDDAVKSLSFGRDTMGQILGPMDVPAPAGPSSAQQRRDLQLRSTRAGRGLGSDDVEGRYQLRLATAQAEYDIDLKDAQAKHDLRAQEDALNQLVEKRYDATLEREQKIAEIIERQKQTFEQGLVGLIDAARSGHAGTWARGQLNKIGDEVLGKIAGIIFDQIKSRTTSGTISIHDALGSAAKDAEVDNTTATKDNTDALLDLTAALRGTALSSSGGGGSAGSGGRISFPGGSGSPGVIMQGFPGGSVGLPGGGMGGSGISSAASSAMRVAGAGVAAYGAYQDFRRGGASGDLQGLGDLALGAAAFTGPAAPFVAAGGMLLKIVGGLLHTGPEARESQIQDRLKNHQFLAPVAVSASMSTSGGYSDFDRFGNVRDSGLSPFPTVEQGFFDYRHNQAIPGRVVSQFGGPGGGAPTVNLTVHALDTKNIMDRHADIADAVGKALEIGSSPHLAQTLTARHG